MHAGVCLALEKLESHSPIASFDSNASLVFSNLPRASITRTTGANHEPIVNLQYLPKIVGATSWKRVKDSNQLNANRNNAELWLSSSIVYHLS